MSQSYKALPNSLEPAGENGSIRGDPIKHFRFGFEVEVVLGLKEAQSGDQSWESMVPALLELLKTKLSPWIVQQGIKGSVNYNHLSVVRDNTIKSPENRRFDKTMFGVEFVSPILTTVNDDSITMLKSLWEALDESCDLEKENFTCGTHIHVSPLPREGESGEWGIRNLQALARAILVFDPVMDALVPEGRRKNNKWSASNIFSTLVQADIHSARGTLRVAFERIGRMTNADQLDLYISPQKRFAFSFEQLTAESNTRCGTVEFRRPPMSHNTEETMQWASFVCLFFRAAVAQSDTLREIYAGRSYETDVSELYVFLQRAVDPKSELFGDKYLTDIFFNDKGDMKIYDFTTMTVNLPWASDEGEKAYLKELESRLSEMMGRTAEHDGEGTVVSQSGL